MAIVQWSLTLAALAVSQLEMPVFAAQHLVPTKKLLVKNAPSGARKILWKVREATSTATIVGDPTADGATLHIELTTGGDQCVTMPASGWTAIGTGFKYKDATLENGPVKVAMVKKAPSGAFLVKAILLNSGSFPITVTPGGPTTSYATNFTLGTGDEYCGGSASATPNPNDATIFKVSNDGAPAACVASCSPSTPTCTCGASIPTTLTFRHTPPPVPAVCGSVTNTAGSSTNLNCNGHYMSSGSAVLPPQGLPLPDASKALRLNVDSCDGEALLLGATTAAETGDIKTCTSAGCFFDAPMPLPSPAPLIAVSLCVVNTYADDVVGEATCDDGSVSLDVRLNANWYITGDILPRRCLAGTNPGGRCTTLGVDPACTGGGTCLTDSDVQPCPICNPVTGICNGGADDGMPCTPGGGQGIALPQFPTSHDCAVSTTLLAGSPAVPLVLSTGTQTDVATPNTGNTQQRVFCGFCRDVDGTGRFGICTAGPNTGSSCAITADCGAGGVCTPAPCGSDADCAADPVSREACVQRNEGAFGPNGGTNMTITEIGTPAGDFGDFLPHVGTLVSVFCQPPTFNAIIDGNADLPGPAAISLPGAFHVTP